MLSFVSELYCILELLGCTEDRILFEEVGAVISAECRGKISSCLLYSVSEVEVSELACTADGSVIDDNRIPDHRELAESLLLVAAEALRELSLAVTKFALGRLLYDLGSRSRESVYRSESLLADYYAGLLDVDL